MKALLTEANRQTVTTARRAILGTIAADGRPRLVPICFVLLDDVVWSPLDEKPKSVDDVRSLARVRDIERDRRVTLLVDRWSEDWSELTWLRIAGRAEVVGSEAAVVAALRAKYPQYVDHDLEARPISRGQAHVTARQLARYFSKQPVGGVARPRDRRVVVAVADVFVRRLARPRRKAMLDRGVLETLNHRGRPGK